MALNKHMGRMAKGLMVFMLMAVAWGGAPRAVCAGTDSAVIFMYHRFGDSRYPSTNVRMDQFKAQLAYLEEGGFHVAPLGEVAAALKKGEALQEKTVVITMDDAYATVYDNAWPLLKEKGWPFTVFVATDAVDRNSREYMSWDQMREMKQHGVQFGNHTATHPYMVRMEAGETEAQWRDRLTADVRKGQRRLEEELGETPLLFAYPYGEYNTQVADLVSGMGYLAFGQHSGGAGRYTDFRAAPRFPVSEAYGEINAFKTKANSLALPVAAMTPWEPHTRDRRPDLELELAPSGALLDELTCYVSGQGRVAIEWVVPGKRFKVQADKDLPPGRHKYNITVPDETRRKYYWFSRQWVVEE
ncbi:polysaccharide deacetylase [Desulfoluna limicola]|uniref:Polysaccharide deacetylase n=1 Tax=Desulfoluna limicola TaxID=2810562 RepID=A0ABM7PF64_9BACT|nr:polysaccharide deacetylase family protein [Desulfoluna limicola]BCS95871.1 polysaccharide deacetylase [Desulfoluna limicola]